MRVQPGAGLLVAMLRSTIQRCLGSKEHKAWIKEGMTIPIPISISIFFPVSISVSISTFVCPGCYRSQDMSLGGSNASL
jgi:hypothetical protein